MIGWKLVYLAVAAVVYIVLISLFFNIKNEGKKKCSYSNPCVRFCQSNRNIISDSELRKKYESTSFFKYDFYFPDDKNVTIYREELKCSEKITLSMNNLRPVGKNFNLKIKINLNFNSVWRIWWWLHREIFNQRILPWRDLSKFYRIQIAGMQTWPIDT